MANCSSASASISTREQQNANRYRIRNFEVRLNEKDLLKYFRKFGIVKKLKVMHDKNETPLGFGFIYVEDTNTLQKLKNENRIHIVKKHPVWIDMKDDRNITRITFKASAELDSKLLKTYFVSFGYVKVKAIEIRFAYDYSKKGKNTVNVTFKSGIWEILNKGRHTIEDTAVEIIPIFAETESKITIAGNHLQNTSMIQRVVVQQLWENRRHFVTSGVWLIVSYIFGVS